MIASLESTLPEAPPSQRDLEVYEFVAVCSKTTREAASAFGISQTRVRQVLTRVVEFLVQAVPGDDDEHTKEQKLAAAQRLTGMRLDFLYCEALSHWRQSSQPTATSPVAIGKVCFLNQAMCIAVAASKVPIRPIPVLAVTEEPMASSPANPPVRDCSENAVSRSADSIELSSPPSAKDETAANYRSLDDIKAEARREFLRPAQTPDAEPISLPERGDEPSPAESRLSRKERRIRQ